MTHTELEAKIATVLAQIRYGELMDDFFYTLGKGTKLQMELNHLRAELAKLG